MTIENFSKMYIAVPQKTIIQDQFLVNSAIFLFAEEEARSQFSKLNNSAATTTIDELKKNLLPYPFVINNKSVYFEYIIPKLKDFVDMDIIYIYDDIQFSHHSKKTDIKNYISYIDGNYFFYKKKLYNEIKLKYNYHEIKNCPICHCEYSFPIFNKSTYLGAFGSKKDYIFDNDIKQKFCKNCGLIYVEKTFDLEFYFEYLNRLYDLKIEGIVQEYSHYKSDLRARMIEKYIKKNKVDNILEVGSFDGKTLSDLKKKYSCKATGIEPFTNCAADSIKLFPELQNSILNTTFELFQEHFNKTTKYDVILFTFSFRHIIDPKNAVKFLKDITNNQGLVIIDEASFIDDSFTFSNIYDTKLMFHQSKNFYYSIHHIIFLLESVGFEFISYERNVLGSSMRYYSALIFKYTGVARENPERLESAFFSSVGAVLGNKLMAQQSDILDIYDNVSETVARSSKSNIDG